MVLGLAVLLAPVAAGLCVTTTGMEKILGENGKVVGAALCNVRTGETEVLDAAGLVVAIGRNPRSVFRR